jgi:hypothetical protein
MRATFDLLTLQTPTSQGHLESLRASDKTIPPIDDPAIYERSFSPKQAVFYHSALPEWLPMVAYELPESISAPVTPGVNLVNPDTEGDSVPLGNSGNDFPDPQKAPDLAQIIAVTQALGKGMSRSKIISDVLGFKGRKYNQGNDLYTRILAIIQENSTND